MQPEQIPSPAPAVDILPSDGLPPQASPRTVRWIELILLLAVAFGSALYQAVAAWAGVLPINPMGQHRWLFGLVHEVTALGLCAYILHKQGRSFRQIGLVTRWYDLFYGVGIMLLGLAATKGMIYILYHAGFYAAVARQTHASSVAQFMGTQLGVAAVVFVVCNAFFEELIVRAYLMTDLRFLTGSAFVAIIGSAVFQGVYHLYQGWQAALAVTAGFVVFSLFYVWSRRITPIIFAHMLWDLYMTANYIYWQARHHA